MGSGDDRLNFRPSLKVLGVEARVPLLAWHPRRMLRGLRRCAQHGQDMQNQGQTRDKTVFCLLLMSNKLCFWLHCSAFVRVSVPALPPARSPPCPMYAHPRLTVLLVVSAIVGTLVFRCGNQCGSAEVSATRASKCASPPSVRLSRGTASAPRESKVTAISGDSVRTRSRAALENFREHLAHFVVLGESDKGAADELRCQVEALLASEDCGPLVSALSPAELSSEFGCRALAHWAEADPLVSAVWLANQPAPSLEEIYVVAGPLAHTPESLAAAMSALAGNPWRDLFLELSSRALGASDPERAVAVARQLSRGDRRSALLISLADDCARQDPLRAARWIAAEPDPVLRQRLITAGALAQTSADPLGAIAWTLSLDGPSSANIPVLEQIVGVWRRFAPDTAARFAGTAGLHPEPFFDPACVE